MATLNKIRLGLEIIEKNLGPDDYKYIQAEHDEIFAGDKPAPESGDGKKLIELGWRWSDEDGCWTVFT